MIVLSGIPQLEYLVFYYPEVVGISTRKHAICVFVIAQPIFTSTVEGLGEVGRRVSIVASIRNANVMTTSKNRTTTTVTVKQLIIPLGHKLLPHVQREDEGPAPAVLDIITISV